MASAANAALCAIVATAFWTLLGYAIGRHIFPRILAIGTAAIIGWAVYNSVTLPIFGLFGFSPVTVASAIALCVIGSCTSIFALSGKSDTEPAPAIAMWVYLAAAVLALVPAAAILPKIAADSVQLASPIFDHSKVAMIDAMARLGLPPVNPFFGEDGTPGRLAYYYLWYFSAAQLSLVLGVSGWEADIGLTWFSAYASLTLMMGLAVWLSKRSAAAIWVVLLAGATSLRATLITIFGTNNLEPFLLSSTGFAGWMFQATWVPQHLTSASCVVVAMLLLSQYAVQQNIVLLAVLILVVAAGFESSTYVGGITFSVAALIAVPILLFSIDKVFRLRFAIGLLTAAVLAAGLAAPFLFDQIATVGARGAGAPIVIDHFAVLGEMFTPFLRRLLDLLAYWLILMPIEFPATYCAGALALVVMLRAFAALPEKFATAAFASLTVAGLAVSWLLVSTLGGNNDLALRAVIAPAMILIASAAAGMVLRPRRAVIIAAALGGLLLSLPDAVRMIHYNFAGDATPAGQAFAQSPQMWAAVRQHATPNARVGNNPLFLQDMTPWPVNISWALLANRSSCFAGLELTLAYAPLTRERRETINAQFIRVFEGQSTAEDISDLASKYGCEVVALTVHDKAWDADPFASSANYRLAEAKEGQWRIYTQVPATAPAVR